MNSRLAAALVGLVSCSSLCAQETLLTIEPTPEQPRNSEGDIIELADGRLCLIYTRFRGGTSDHAHLLISAHPQSSVADLMRCVKTNSSKWIHQTFPNLAAFAWQAGYAAFSVSHSNRAQVQSYIRQQEEHHRSMSFEEEFVEFLRRHGVHYDERYLWQ